MVELYFNLFLFDWSRNFTPFIIPTTLISEFGSLNGIVEIRQNLDRFIGNSTLERGMIVEFLSKLICSSFDPSFLFVPLEISPSENE